MGGKDLSMLQKSSKSIKRKNRYVPSNFKCQYCIKKFSKHYELEVHIATFHTCTICSFRGQTLRNHHCIFQSGAGLKAQKNHVTKFNQVNALRGHIATFKYSCSPHFNTIPVFLNEHKNDIKEILKENFRKRLQIKVQLCVWADFKRMLKDDEYEYSPIRALNSNLLVLLNINGFDNFFNECITKISNTVDIFFEFGSGWSLNKIHGLDINISTFKPFLGGCNADLPAWLQNKMSILNVKCTDNKCFQWSVLAALHPHKRSSYRNRISSYEKYVKKYDFNCIKFPTSLNQISVFENKNEKRKLAINVFGYTNDKSPSIFPYRISKLNYMKGYKAVNLLMTKCSSNHVDIFSKNSYLYHFSTISNLDRLLGKHNSHSKKLCLFCLQRISAKTDMSDHVVRCKNFDNQRVRMPQCDKSGKKPVHKFKNFYKKLKVSYVVYADFECILQRKWKGKLRKQKIVNDLNIDPFIIKEQRHLCSGFSWALIRSDGKLIQKKVYRGLRAVPIFLKQMRDLREKVFQLNRQIVPVKNDPKILNSIRNETTCHICYNPLNSDIVLDHDHVTGEIRGYAHNECNMNFKQRNKLYVVFHNFKSYDSQLVVHGLQKFENIKVVPSGSSEKFMSLEIDHMIFLDSLQFLISNLGSLVKNLVDSKHTFPILNQVFRPALSRLLTRKGIFCYDYIDSWGKFKEKKLPSRAHFYNFLTDENISVEDHKYARKVFSKFKCKSIGTYHDIYLLSDTLLLAEVFENFRKMSLAYYKIDPLYYYSTPGLAWDAALLFSKIQLEQIVDVDKYIFFEDALRGGVTMITKRWAKAQNKYIDPQNVNKNTNYIVYLDKNNLYGEVMRWNLPVNGFKWLKCSNINLQDILDTSSQSKIGYFLEVDLKYPQSLHDLHQELPLAPESKAIPTEWLSPYQSKLLQKLNLNYNEKQKKLISHFGDRSKYIVHYENLKYYVQAGMQVTAVHRVMQFNQSPWLKSFIEFNTARRAEGKTKFEKDFFKLINNAIYGKSCQNMRRQLNVKLTNNVEAGLKLISSPLCQSVKIIRKDTKSRPGLIQVTSRPKFVKLDKPIYIGCSVLELSKLSMFRFHYQKIKKWYGNRAQLLMTDTDSLIYDIITHDFYEDMTQHSHHFDFSEYNKDNFLHSEVNKKKIGKMKDELNGNVILSFVAPGIKTYSILTKDGKQKSAAKGVKHSIREQYLLHKVYKNVLRKQNKLFSISRHIRSYKHKLFTILSYKAAMHPFDSKRYILSNGVSTLPYLHYKLNKN